jgi:hypothetical protein
MIEKPFGRDSATFDELNQLTAKHFSETQLYRLDHYLGKEVRRLASPRAASSRAQPCPHAAIHPPPGHPQHCDAAVGQPRLRAAVEP